MERHPFRKGAPTWECGEYMPSIFDTDKGVRWPRSQKFSLSDQGTRAEQDYREVIAAARSDAASLRSRAARMA